MQALQRLTATRVVEALQEREHIIVAPGSSDALGQELEGIIAAPLTAFIANCNYGADDRRNLSTTFGCDAADDAVEAMVDAIGERLMESDHVDDIFAEDRLIRRDSFRAIRDVLLSYLRGEIDVDPDRPKPQTHTVLLSELGYLVATVAQHVTPELLHETLERAAKGVNASVSAIDHAAGQVNFELSTPSSEQRLAIEEAITEQVVMLVDSGLVELPSVEQVLQLSGELSARPGFSAALSTAARLTQERTGCSAVCTIIDAENVLATLTPLTDDDARNVETHFATFLDQLERALTALKDAPPTPPETASRRRRRRCPAGGKKAKPRRRAAPRSSKSQPSGPTAYETGRTEQATKGSSGNRNKRRVRATAAARSGACSLPVGSEPLKATGPAAKKKASKLKGSVKPARTKQAKTKRRRAATSPRKRMVKG